MNKQTRSIDTRVKVIEFYKVSLGRVTGWGKGIADGVVGKASVRWHSLTRDLHEKKEATLSRSGSSKQRE